MKQLDLGRHGGPWTPEHVRSLREAVGISFLMSRPKSLVLKEFKKYYRTERSDNSLLWQIKKCFDENKLLFERWENKRKVYWMIREFSEIPDRCNIPKDLKLEKFDKTRSAIALLKKDDTLFYIHPIVPDADYAKMFLRIFKKENAGVTFGEDVKKFYKFEKEKKVCIPLMKSNDSDSSYNKLITAVWYCLDLLFAGLVSELEKGCGKPIKLPSLRKKVKRIIRILKGYGYFFSEEKRLTDLLNRPEMNVTETFFFGQINEIEISENRIEIPTYTIWTSRFFELYVYCVLSDANPNLNFVYKSNKSGGIPDVTVGNDCIVDAKYKFQYGDNDCYCDVEDASRMSKYLVELAMAGGNKNNPYGIFCFPDVDGKEEFDISRGDDGKNMILKKGISFPMKKSKQ